MPFNFEYSVRIQKYNSGFKIHYNIPKRYFDNKPELFETFINKIVERKDENDFIPYRNIIENAIDIKSVVDKLLSLKCVKLEDESYFLTEKHHIIQEFKQFNKSYYQLKKFERNLNDSNLYSGVVKKFIDTKSCINELVKLYKAELEKEYKAYVNFDDYSEEKNNINKLHTDIILAMNDHKHDYEGACFEILTVDDKSSDESPIEDVVYYKSINRLSKRFIRYPRISRKHSTDPDSDEKKDKPKKEPREPREPRESRESKGRFRKGGRRFERKDDKVERKGGRRFERKD